MKAILCDRCGFFGTPGDGKAYDSDQWNEVAFAKNIRAVNFLDPNPILTPIKHLCPECSKAFEKFIANLTAKAIERSYQGRMATQESATP